VVTYRRPKFLETLLEIRRELAHSVDYDVDLFVEMVRSGDDHQLDLTTGRTRLSDSRSSAVEPLGDLIGKD